MHMSRSMTRAWTLIAQLSVATLLSACSGGTYPTGYYSGGRPYNGDDDGAASDEGDTGIDLDGGGPPPPPDGLPPPEGHGDCCEGHDWPGCDNEPVEQCVCESDSWCCESEWDKACAALIEQLGCGHCTAGDPPPPPGGDTGGDTGGAPPPPGGDTGGDTGGDPPPGGDTGGAPPLAGDGDCCTNNGTPGCDDAAIESCVCMQDDYCCNTAWDGLCVSQVESFGCGSCGGPGGGGVSACCQQQPGAGCPDAAVQACVCAADPYCCDVFWDLTCVGEVESLSCGSCS